MTLKKPIYSKSVAIWLIENTALTFKQIADFCSIHILEVEALANEEIHKTLQGINPIHTGELTQEDITKCEQNPDLSLTYIENIEYNNLQKKYSAKEVQFKIKQLDKLGAILWIINTYDNASPTAIAKLLKTTSSNVKKIKEQTHKDMLNISPIDPISLGLINQQELIAFENNNNNK